MAASSSFSLHQLQERLKAEQDRLIRDYLAVEQRFYDHTESVVYDELDTNAKSIYTRELNKIVKKREEMMEKVESVKKRLSTTSSLIGEDVQRRRHSETTRKEYCRLPSLPEFRGTHSGSIRDPFEFLGKTKAFLTAHDVPLERWCGALLTALNGFDRQWAEANLRDTPWEEVEVKFLQHFETPAIRDKLVRELTTIRQKRNETVQQYSDRFTSLMARTGRRDDDETLVAIYIEGLDYNLQQAMYGSRAAALNMWMRSYPGSPEVSISYEIAQAITLDATKPKRDGETMKEDTRASENSNLSKKPRCGICRGRHKTEDQRRSKEKEY